MTDVLCNNRWQRGLGDLEFRRNGTFINHNSGGWKGSTWKFSPEFDSVFVTWQNGTTERWPFDGETLTHHFQGKFERIPLRRK